MASSEPKLHPSHCTIRPRTGQQRANVLGNGRRTKAPSKRHQVVAHRSSRSMVLNQQAVISGQHPPANDDQHSPVWPTKTLHHPICPEIRHQTEANDPEEPTMIEQHQWLSAIMPKSTDHAQINSTGSGFVPKSTRRLSDQQQGGPTRIGGPPKAPSSD
ncbi:hypothetical protein ACLOJK_006816 [Asimina triloba]